MKIQSFNLVSRYARTFKNRNASLNSKQDFANNRSNDNNAGNLSKLSNLSNCSKFINFTSQSRENELVYVFNPFGDYIIYENRKQLEEELGITGAAFNNNVQGNIDSTTSGLVYAYSGNIESVGKDGEIFLNPEKVKELIRRANTKVIYVITPDGNLRKYQNREMVMKEFGFNKDKMNKILNGGRKPPKGHAFIKAEDIEYEDEKGNIRINYDTLNEYMSKMK